MTARLSMLLVVLALLLAGPALAARPVSLALVLALDVSSSVDAAEYRLEIGGVAAALRDPDVVAAVEATPGGIALAVLQWSGSDDIHPGVPWTRVHGRADLAAVAARVERLGRVERSGVTALGEALARAHALLVGRGFAAVRRVIDVSGDGRSNQGRPLAPARDAVLADGITINGLAVHTMDEGMERYYREALAGGPGAFVIDATSFQDFARAMQAKLLREIGEPAVALGDGGARPAPGRQ